MYHVSEDLNLQ